MGANVYLDTDLSCGVLANRLYWCCCYCCCYLFVYFLFYFFL